MEESKKDVVIMKQPQIVANKISVKELVNKNIKLKVMLTFAGVLLGISAIEVLMYVLPPVFSYAVSIDLMPVKDAFFSVQGIILTFIFLVFLGGTYWGSDSYYKDGKMTEQEFVHDLGIIIPWAVLALCVFAIQLWSLLQR